MYSGLVALLVVLQEYTDLCLLAKNEIEHPPHVAKELFVSELMPAIVVKARFTMDGRTALGLGGGQVAALVRKVVDQNGVDAVFSSMFGEHDGQYVSLGQHIMDNSVGILILPELGKEGFWLDKLYTEAWVVSHSWGNWHVERTQELVDQVKKFADDLEDAALQGYRNNDLHQYTGH